MTPQSFILQALQSRSTPIKRIELLRLLMENDFKITDREMRRLIIELLEAGECIASSEKGYKLINSLEEKEEARIYQKKKAWAIWNHAKMIHENFERKFRPNNLKQLTFEEFMK